jgi:IclR family acetate operon transcriptional repressor
MLAFVHSFEAEEILKKKPRPKLTSKTMTSIPALLKALKRVREQGYAVDDEETERGARCVAAPIFNAQGKPIGAISISGPVSHLNSATVAQVGQMLLEATRKISEQLGFRPPLKARSRIYYE